MGAYQVDIGLRDSGHADLVIGPGEEGGKGAGEWYSAVTGATSNGNADLKRKAFFSYISPVK